MAGPHVVLGVSGGIAAYKAADIVRGLRRAGADVTVTMTEHARQFIAPLTLAALSGHRVITSPFDPPGEGAGGWEIEHIDLARRCDLLLVAPATASLLGRMAAGIADDFLTTLYLAVTCPVVVAPAMNTAMWDHPAVRDNVARLRARGVEFIDPEHGALASSLEGEGIGRLADPAAIVERVMRRLEAPDGVADRPLAGRRVLVTAGPTREPIDQVRFLSNPSTGKMGFAVAGAARRLGAEVILVSGPTDLPDPEGVMTLRVTTAAQMRDAVMSRLEGVAVVVKAAAVSDFRPARTVPGKVRKEDAALEIRLERTADILEEIARDGNRLVVGFAAEAGDPVDGARAKLTRKNLDLIVANDISRDGAGFASDQNEVTVLGRDGLEERWPRMSKEAVADRLMRLVARRLP